MWGYFAGLLGIYISFFAEMNESISPAMRVQAETKR